ncbi:MAG: protein-L-isoaspartate(D-aspartate) O-methyltransferase [Deltaproteobacteria bacterium]|nr:protein-L-isoaspartate(D-aspartate) O-methyltransferase [Deltaproteobacteria bacterium]
MKFEPALRRLAAQTAEALPVRNPRVVEALAAVPRHLFVDEALRARAYADDALPIGYGQTISRLSTVARMTEALDPGPTDRILEVGTGSGYQAAVLAKLSGEVYSVERIRALAVRAQKTLHRLGIFGVTVRAGDGALGWPEAAPFQGILVAAVAREVPEALLHQLAVGGRLVLPVGGGDDQCLRRIVRESNSSWRDELLESCRFVPLIRSRG